MAATAGARRLPIASPMRSRRPCGIGATARGTRVRSVCMHDDRANDAPYAVGLERAERANVSPRRGPQPDEIFGERVALEDRELLIEARHLARVGAHVHARFRVADEARVVRAR